MPGEGGEVVTRQPYRKVWLDHLLSKEFNTVSAGNRRCTLMIKPKLSSLPAI